MLAAPELIESESVEMRDQRKVALELEDRVLPDGMMRREEAAELQR